MGEVRDEKKKEEERKEFNLQSALQEQAYEKNKERKELMPMKKEDIVAGILAIVLFLLMILSII